MIEHFLYVIAPAAHENGPCKLGISSGDPNRRLKQLQTGHPERLSVRHIEPVAPEKARIMERLLHRDIGYLRAHGEWFNLSVKDAIAHVTFTIIQYDGVFDLTYKFRSNSI